MISGEDFQALEEQITEGVEVAQERIKDLLDTIRALDLQLLIAQNALDLTLTNLNNVVPELAQKVLSMCGRTDQKIKKKIAELSAGVVAECEGSVQSYLAKATIEALGVLGIQLPEPEDDDDWTPNNHD